MPTASTPEGSIPTSSAYTLERCEELLRECPDGCAILYEKILRGVREAEPETPGRKQTDQSNGLRSRKMKEYWARRKAAR